MIKKMLLIAILAIATQGCIVAPLALLGPATSGFSTASLIQTGVSTGLNFHIKKNTGKTISEHVFDSITRETLKQTYSPIQSIEEIKISTK